MSTVADNSVNSISTSSAVITVQHAIQPTVRLEDRGHTVLTPGNGFADSFSCDVIKDSGNVDTLTFEDSCMQIWSANFGDFGLTNIKNTLLIRMDHYFWPKFAKAGPDS